VASKKPRNAPNPQIIRAVQNYILGAGKVSQERAMLDAGYAATTAKKQCQLITHHPLYREYLLAKAAEVTVSKDFLNLKYLMILVRPKLTLSDEFKALDRLATINGFGQGNTLIVPTGNSSINLTEIIQNFKGKTPEELKEIVTATKNRLDRFTGNDST